MPRRKREPRSGGSALSKKKGWQRNQDHRQAQYRRAPKNSSLKILRYQLVDKGPETQYDWYSWVTCTIPHVCDVADKIWLLLKKKTNSDVLFLCHLAHQLGTGNTALFTLTKLSTITDLRVDDLLQACHVINCCLPVLHENIRSKLTPQRAETLLIARTKCAVMVEELCRACIQ